MKIIIAGGRNYSPKRNHMKKIKNILYNNACILVLSGAADGADLIGEMVAGLLGIKIKRFPADWKKYSKKAGPLRNEEMAKFADGCILLPGEDGTANMKMNAEKYGLKIWEIK